MTKDDIAAIRDRWAATTLGPWMFDMAHSNILSTNGRSICLVAQRVGKTTAWNSGIQDADNAAFIAASHDDIPALLREVEILRELYETAMNQLGATRSRAAATEQELERIRKLLKRALKGKSHA